jgi:hypothetical protein
MAPLPARTPPSGARRWYRRPMAVHRCTSQGCEWDAVSPFDSSNEGTAMKDFIKSGTFRALLLLSALASSGLVLEAARRW